MLDNIMNFLINIIFWCSIILYGLARLILLPFGGISKTNSKNKNNKIKIERVYQIKPNENKSSGLTEIQKDYDEKLKKELIKEGKYRSYNFEEEDLEEDDYYYDDDK